MVFIRQRLLLVLGLCTIAMICEAAPHNEASSVKENPSQHNPRSIHPYRRNADTNIISEDYKPIDEQKLRLNRVHDKEWHDSKEYGRESHDHKEHDEWHDHKEHDEWHNPKEHGYKDHRSIHPYRRNADSGIMSDEYSPVDEQNLHLNRVHDKEWHDSKEYGRESHDHKEHDEWRNRKEHEWRNPKEHEHKDSRNTRSYRRNAEDEQKSYPDHVHDQESHNSKEYGRESHDHKEHDEWHDHKEHDHDWHNPKEHGHKDFYDHSRN